MEKFIVKVETGDVYAVNKYNISQAIAIYLRNNDSTIRHLSVEQLPPDPPPEPEAEHD